MEILSTYKDQRLSEITPYVKNMDKLFEELYVNFEKKPFVNKEDLPTLPGVYVFYKEEKPIYVGRANNIKQRVAGHTRPSSGHYSANFAFNLTKLELADKFKESKLGRQDLFDNPEFFDLFSRYKIELSVSKLKYIEIKNDILQAMFEPYLAVKLGTYPVNNNFDNH